MKKLVPIVCVGFSDIRIGDPQWAGSRSWRRPQPSNSLPSRKQNLCGVNGLDFQFVAPSGMGPACRRETHPHPFKQKVTNRTDKDVQFNVDNEFTQFFSKTRQ